LIQGGFLQTTTTTTITAASFATIPNARADEYRPALLERGMVAWAGGKGGPHFFIAVADHPEWGNAHTVWAQVHSLEDLHKLDTLLVTRPLRTAISRNKNSPVVSNFVTPIPFTIHRVQ
jgi:cyclophilin family peptidyl-prolyl cis-trans isomerase